MMRPVEWEKAIGGWVCPRCQAQTKVRTDLPAARPHAHTPEQCMEFLGATVKLLWNRLNSVIESNDLYDGG